MTHHIDPLPGLHDRPSPVDALTPLLLIFWGLVLVIIDFKVSQSSTRSVNGVVTSMSGFSVDLISDSVGYAMMLWALLKLLKFEVISPYRGLL